MSTLVRLSQSQPLRLSFGGADYDTFWACTAIVSTHARHIVGWAGIIYHYHLPTHLMTKACAYDICNELTFLRYCICARVVSSQPGTAYL